GFTNEDSYKAIGAALSSLNDDYARTRADCLWTLESNHNGVVVVGCTQDDYYSARYSLSYDEREVVLRFLSSKNLGQTATMVNRYAKNWMRNLEERLTNYVALTAERREMAKVRAMSPDGTKSGTGFFVSTQGHLVTNYHVVRGASKVFVKLADKR